MKMMNHLTRFALITALAAFTPAATAENESNESENGAVAGAVIGFPHAAAIEKGSLTTVIHDSKTFSILTKALKAAGLDQTLGQKGTYTIFAPTDEAFQKLDAGTLDKLLLPENKEKLRSLLLYHVVAGKVMAADLKDGEVKTMNGEKIEVDVDDNGKDVEIDDAKVFSTDVPATNGVMHSIGSVLVPDSLDGFAGLDD